MRYALIGLLGLLGGFLLGGVQPRREAGDLRTELRGLRDQLVEADKKASHCGPTLFPSVPGLDRMTRSESGAQAPADEPAAEGEPDGPQVTVVGPHGEQGPPGDPAEQFDLAIEAQRVRIEQTRAALAEQADLDDSEVGRLDEIASRMNDRLAAHAAELVEVAMSGDQPSPGDMLAMSHEVTGILYDSQVDLDNLVGPDRSQDVEDDALAVWNYIDLETFRPAIEAAHSGPHGAGR